MNFFKNSISIFLIGLLLTFSLVTNVSALPEVSQNDKNIEKTMDQYINELSKQHPFSGSILVVQKGKVIFRKGYGMADYEYNIANKPETKFTLASITKQFVAAGTMILQEKGKLNVKDPIIKYIPDYPNGDKIKIENLLTHTSGIAEYLDLGFIASNESKKTYKTEDLVKLFKDKPLSFEPGKQFSYCNSNYVLLGYIIEKVSGTSCENFLTENIFKPLGMNNTGFYLDSIYDINKANPYFRGEEKIEDCEKNNAYMKDQAAYMAGGMYSTVDDLYLWHRALSDGKLLKKESLNQINKPFFPNPDYGYGYGVEIFNINNQKCIRHTGSMPGVLNYFMRYLDEDTCIIVLSNLREAKIFTIGTNLYTILNTGKYEKPEEFKEVTLDKKVLDQYVGKYEVAPGVNMEVVEQSNKLYACLGNEKSALNSYAENKFFHKFVDITLEFKDIENGKANKILVKNADVPSEWKRVK